MAGWFGGGGRMVWRGWQDGLEGVAGWFGGGGRMVWRGWQDGLEGVAGWFGGGGRMVWRGWQDGLEGVETEYFELNTTKSWRRWLKLNRQPLSS